MENLIFYNANEAFVYLCSNVLSNGIERGSSGRKWWSTFNMGITILNPIDNVITIPWRNFKLDYAKIEFDWYLSKDRSAAMIEKYASIWKDIKDENGLLNSNYGYLMCEDNQYQKIIDKLKSDECSRQAIITIYDGKRYLNMNTKDVPCTLNMGFRIVNNKLDMSIIMRSLDIWFGFSNDQYCFSEFQKIIAKDLSIGVGNYYHFSMDAHLYEKHYLKVKNNLNT